jgi:poly(hydroxyalkanoate) depolymerase family esterase
MRRSLPALLLAAVLAPLAVPTAAQAGGSGTLSHHTLPAGATYPSRQYYRYIPRDLAAPRDRALVVYLHGCTQPAIEAVKGVRWNELADRRGFLVVYPDQRVPDGPTDPDGSAARCWSPGQAEAVPRGSGELGTIAEITRRVARAYDVHPGRIYVTGISGGAMMATAMAVVYPDLYTAVGHVENCGYVCDPTGELAYRHMGPYARVVPAMIVQGSADFVINPAMSESSVTQWIGINDRADNGQRDGSVPLTPTRIEHDMPPGTPAPPTLPGTLCTEDLTHHNPCPGGVVGPYPVTRRSYVQRGGPVVVEAWTIHGLSHNYSGGDAAGSFTDPYGPNITPPLFDFFQAHARVGRDAPRLAPPPAPAPAQGRRPSSCRRRVSVRGFLRLGRRQRLRSATVRVGRGRARTLRGRALRRPVVLSLRRAGSRVRIVARTRGGRRVARTRTLRCGRR